MHNQNIEYPRDWTQASRLVKNLNREIYQAYKENDTVRDRNKHILKVSKLAYTILKALDEAINASEDHKEIKRLNSARRILVRWIKKKRFRGSRGLK